MAGGALGNLVDRFRLGHVVDFIDLRFWPVFNLADTAIVMGGMLLVIYFIWLDRDGQKRCRIKPLCWLMKILKASAWTFLWPERMETLSRSQIKRLIEDGQVWVDGKVRKSSYRVKTGEVVAVEVPQDAPVRLQPENIPLEIIFQDSDVVVFNKPKGLVVHPAHGNWEHTLVNALLYHVKDPSGINGELRPGIVHRLDKDTSGVMVAAKNDMAHRELARQIKAHTIERQYLAVVYGVIKENLGTIEAPIGRSKTDRKKWW